MENENCVDKEEFYENLATFYRNKPGKKPYTIMEKEKIISEIETAKAKKGMKERREYHLLHNYDVIESNGVSFLIKKQQQSRKIISIVCYEDLYDRLYEYHVKITNHGGQVKMRKYINSKMSIPRPAVNIFLRCCKNCKNKRETGRNTIPKVKTVQPIKNTRGQVDLINFQSLPDHEYKWILLYKDLRTGFILLRPLQTKRASEVAIELLKIFLEMGAPKILQSSNGTEFVDQIIQELRCLWPECVQVRSTIEVESSEKDIEELLRIWISEHKLMRWSLGLYYVQWQKNIKMHNTVLRKCPYKTLFGCDPKAGFGSDNIPQSILSKLNEEDDLKLLNLHENDDHSEFSGDNTYYEGENHHLLENVISFETHDLKFDFHDGIKQDPHSL